MKRLSAAYREIARMVLFFAAGSILTAAIGFAIVTPLWFLAVRYRIVFTYAVFASAVALFIWFFVSSSGKDRNFPAAFLRAILRFAFLVAAAVLIFCSLLLFRYGYIFHSASVIMLIFLAAGIVRMLYSRQN